VMLELLKVLSATLLVGLLLLLLSFFLRIMFRFFLRPKVNIKHTIGDVSTEVSNSINLQTRKVSLWIQSTSDIGIKTITFKRICRYKSHCLLFKFFTKVGVLRDRKWCSFANADDFSLNAHGLLEPSDKERKGIIATLAKSGELTLKPSTETIAMGQWIAVDIPLILSLKRPHIIQVTLDYNVDLKNRSKVVQSINSLLDFMRMKNNHVFCTTEKIYIDWGKHIGERPSPLIDTGGKRLRASEGYIGSSYKGITKVDRAQKLISSLQVCITEHIRKYSGKKPQPNKVSTQKIRELLRQELPDADISFTQPPNGAYRAISEEEARELLVCWSICRDFARNF